MDTLSQGESPLYSDPSADRARAYFATKPRGLVLVELCLWGPRMVIAGAKKLHHLGRHRGADRALAAELLAALANRGEGMPTAELYPLAHGRDDAFGDSLAYLLFHDLIGISKSGDRAWLLSEQDRGGEKRQGRQPQRAQATAAHVGAPSGPNARKEPPDATPAPLLPRVPGQRPSRSSGRRWQPAVAVRHWW